MLHKGFIIKERKRREIIRWICILLGYHRRFVLFYILRFILNRFRIRTIAQRAVLLDFEIRAKLKKNGSVLLIVKDIVKDTIVRYLGGCEFII